MTIIIFDKKTFEVKNVQCGISDIYLPEEIVNEYFTAFNLDKTDYIYKSISEDLTMNEFKARKSIVDGMIVDRIETIDELKDKKITILKRNKAIKDSSGFEFLGEFFNSDEKSIQKLETITSAAKSAFILSEEFSVSITTLDNKQIEFNANELIKMSLAIAKFFDTNHQRYLEIKNSILECMSKEELEVMQIEL